MFGEGSPIAHLGAGETAVGTREKLPPCSGHGSEGLSQTSFLAKRDVPVVSFVCSLFPDASDPRDGKSDTESMENMSLDGYRPGPGAAGGR